MRLNAWSSLRQADGYQLVKPSSIKPDIQKRRMSEELLRLLDKKTVTYAKKLEHTLEFFGTHIHRQDSSICITNTHTYIMYMCVWNRICIFACMCIYLFMRMCVYIYIYIASGLYMCEPLYGMHHSREFTIRTKNKHYTETIRNPFLT